MPTKLETYKQLIATYIKVAIDSNEKINEYVPNNHIANTFDEILLFLILEANHPIDFINHPILNILDNYFKQDLIDSDKEREVHRVYQKLRGKDDTLRNQLKLIKIELHDVVMPEICNNTIKYKI